MEAAMDDLIAGVLVKIGRYLNLVGAPEATYTM